MSKTNDELIKEARLAFYKRHAKQDYPKRLVTILDSFETELRQTLATKEQEKADMVRAIISLLREYENPQISIGIHGIVEGIAKEYAVDLLTKDVTLDTNN